MKLAVVIPFYKLTFFADLLSALAAQTDQDFVVYVGNDASVSEAEDICAQFRDRLDIRYHMFMDRLGDRDLAGQWNRCIERVEQADWIWVIPDDDLPSPDCVLEIRQAVRKADNVAADVVHIPCTVVNADGDVLAERWDWPEIMPAGTFFLRQTRESMLTLTLANIVYRADRLHAEGGFISFPKAWGSDHATMLAVAGEHPVVTVPRALLKFRMSSENISAQSSDYFEKLGARLLFAQWLSEQSQRWYGTTTSMNIQHWYYFKSEHTVLCTWPFSFRSARILFQIAEICGLRRNYRQMAGIMARGFLSRLRGLGRKGPEYIVTRSDADQEKAIYSQ